MPPNPEPAPKTGGRLRIAFFSDSARPLVNGVATSIAMLTDELREAGHSVALFAPKFPGYKDPDPNTYRFPSFETVWSRGYPAALPPYWPMLRHFRAREFDLVHIHTPFFVGFTGLRWAESHGLPTVATYHTLYDRYSHYIPILPRRYVRFRLAKHTNFFYNSVDHVVTPTDASLRWLRRHSIRRPVTVIPTGIPRPLAITKGEARAALGLTPGAKILLYVGRLAREKNVETVILAAERMFERDDAVRLVLVGDGPHRAALTNLVRERGMGDRVRFVGAVERHEVDAYYAASDVFLFASITETQGLVVQEAMSYGLPAVAATGGGASEAITHGVDGFVARNRPSDLARYAWFLLEDPSRLMVMAENAQRAVAHLSMPVMADRMVGVYLETLRRAREGAPLPDALPRTPVL